MVELHLNNCDIVTRLQYITIGDDKVGNPWAMWRTVAVANRNGMNTVIKTKGVCTKYGEIICRKLPFVCW